MEGVRNMKLRWMMIALLVATLLVVRAHGPLSVSPSPTPSSSLPSPPLILLTQNADFKFPKLPKFYVPPKVFFFAICFSKCHSMCVAGKPTIVYRGCMAWCLPTRCRPTRLDAVKGCALDCIAAAPNAAPTAAPIFGYDEIDGYNENCFKNCAKKY